MSPSAIQQYFESNAFPALTEALADMFLLQPANPLEWLAARLLKLAHCTSSDIGFTTLKVPASPPDAAIPSPSSQAMTRFIELDAQRHDKAYMQRVFEAHSDVDGGLSPDALLSALKEVGAPILSSSGADVSAQTYHSLADVNLSGVIDLIKFVVSSLLLPNFK